jgi:hypothetical protein
MNRQCKCKSCGYLFNYEDRTVVKESHGFNDGFYETFSCCPNCGGDFEDAVDCCECGETFTEDELYEGWCEKCLRKTITYDTFFEYCEANKKDHYLVIFVMEEILEMDPVYTYSERFYSVMQELYKKAVCAAKNDDVFIGKHFNGLINSCIRFVMDDDGEIGRENYADWLNSKKEVK